MITITKDNFESEVLKSGKPFLLEFWAEWCAPCTMMAAALHSLEEEYGSSISFGKINSDEEFAEEITDKYAVRGLPTLLLFADGKVVERFVGLVPKDNMQNILNYHL